mmetsp:Transcript_40971/g.73694  ORF Transcript_40971/g.73694 Transcript_40971/m.73694 type:complete len:83 (+) Transcript_40971:449-697(+)
MVVTFGPRSVVVKHCSASDLGKASRRMEQIHRSSIYTHQALQLCTFVSFRFEWHFSPRPPVVAQSPSVQAKPAALLTRESSI